jgi:hypothetical protein
VRKVSDGDVELTGIDDGARAQLWGRCHLLVLGSSSEAQGSWCTCARGGRRREVARHRLCGRNRGEAWWGWLTEDEQKALAWMRYNRGGGVEGGDGSVRWQSGWVGVRLRGAEGQ